MALRYKGSYSTLLDNYAKLLQNIISFIFALGLTVQLCISVGTSNYGWLNITTKPLASLMVILTTIIVVSGTMSKIVKWAQKKVSELFEVKLDSEKKFAYLSRMTRDDEMIKMIQSYDGGDLVEDTFKKSSKLIRMTYKKQSIFWNLSSVTESFAGALITVISYGVVTLKILANAISMGSFLKYSQAIVKMNEAILNMVSVNQNISEIMIYMNKLMGFLDLQNKFETGSIPIEKRRDHEYKFCFENVASSIDFDKNKVKHCLNKSGLKHFEDRVNENMDQLTRLDVICGGDKNEKFSGGEKQKIAIARALYKDAALVILDEPTAALDPLSEYDIYQRFDALVGDKTCVYISHRMSSCRFCSDIIVLDQGEIVERGDHESLLSQGKLYSEMWNAQAKYYAVNEKIS